MGRGGLLAMEQQLHGAGGDDLGVFPELGRGGLCPPRPLLERSGRRRGCVSACFAYVRLTWAGGSATVFFGFFKSRACGADLDET
jgi:hypothetical protein